MWHKDQTDIETTVGFALSMITYSPTQQKAIKSIRWHEVCDLLSVMTDTLSS